MQSNRTIWRMIIIAASLTALILLIRDFNSRMADLRRLTADKQRVSLQVTQLVATKQFLETQVAFAESEDAVRKYAYEEGGLQQEGDNVVILVPEGEQPEQQLLAAQTPPAPVEKWQLWLALFVDSPALAAADSP
jgi:cell division protein FtsB